MIDFQNGVFKLARTKEITHLQAVEPMLVNGETALCQYQATRDYVIFTTHRIIAVNIQGLTGKKKDFSFLPYSKVQAFSIETAGTFDVDSELELYFSGLGKVKFEFKADSDIYTIGKMISDRIL